MDLPPFLYAYSILCDIQLSCKGYPILMWTLLNQDIYYGPSTLDHIM